MAPGDTMLLWEDANKKYGSAFETWWNLNLTFLIWKGRWISIPPLHRVVIKRVNT